MIRLYADANVNSALVRALRRRGVDVVTVQEEGGDRWKDLDILTRAQSLDRVVISHDRDFIGIAWERQSSEQFFTGVVILTRPPTQLEPTLSHLELLAKLSEPEEMANQVEYIPYPTRDG